MLLCINCMVYSIIYHTIIRVMLQYILCYITFRKDASHDTPSQRTMEWIDRYLSYLL